MYDNKHPGDWSRGRRNDFSRDRDDRYIRREPYYNPGYSPKRRKLESGEAETVDFDSSRRAPYSPYDPPVPRTPVPRSYYRGTYEPGIRRQHEENHYYPRDYTRTTVRDYQQTARRYPDSVLDTERKGGDSYNQRRLFDDAQVDVGRKRQRPDIPPNRFLSSRQFEIRTPLSPNTPIKHIASTALTLGPRNIYEPQITSKNDELQRSDPNRTINPPLSSSVEQQESPLVDETDEKLSKREIIDRMDQLDNQISQVEGEIEHFKRLKSICQRKTDKSKLSNVDKILLNNQEIATANAEYMQLFQRVDVTSKTKANVIHVPENLQTHTLKRPIMMQHMRRAMLEGKEKTKKMAREFEVKRRKWHAKLDHDKIQTPKSVAAINNALPPSPQPTPQVEVPARGGRRSRTSSDAVRSEAEFTQIMQQLSETEKQDPNVRFLKTLAVIPPMFVDKRDLSRVFMDNNRYVEDCRADYQKHQLTNPWNSEEQSIFLRKYISHPKQFNKIASFLPNKSIEDVICYYFRNKHRLNLKEILEEIQSKKKPTTQRTVRTTIVPKTSPSPSQFVNKEVADLHLSNNDSSYWNTPRERRPKPDRSNRERVMPQRNKTTTTTRTTKTRAKSPPRKTSSAKKNLTVQSAGIDQLCFTANVPAPWNESEINQLKIALASYGSDFKAIADFVSSKNHWQCRSFYYNFKEQLNLAEFFANGVKSSANRDSIAPSRSLHLTSSDSSQKTSSITSLLNSTETQPQETIAPQNWVLEAPETPTTVPKSSFLGNFTNNSITTDSGDKQASSQGRSAFGGFSSSAVNIRHSFDSFSPLESSEMKSSVAWNVADISPTPLRHSSAEFSVSNLNSSPKSFVPLQPVVSPVKTSAPCSQVTEKPIVSENESSVVAALDSQLVSEPVVQSVVTATEENPIQNVDESVPTVEDKDDPMQEDKKVDFVSSVPEPIEEPVVLSSNIPESEVPTMPLAEPVEENQICGDDEPMEIETPVAVPVPSIPETILPPNIVSVPVIVPATASVSTEQAVTVAPDLVPSVPAEVKDSIILTGSNVTINEETIEAHKPQTSNMPEEEVVSVVSTSNVIKEEIQQGANSGRSPSPNENNTLHNPESVSVNSTPGSDPVSFKTEAVDSLSAEIVETAQHTSEECNIQITESKESQPISNAKETMEDVKLNESADEDMQSPIGIDNVTPPLDAVPDTKPEDFVVSEVSEEKSDDCLSVQPKMASRDNDIQEATMPMDIDPVAPTPGDKYFLNPGSGGMTNATPTLTAESTNSEIVKPSNAEVAEALQFEEEIKMQIANASCIVFDVPQGQIPAMNENILHISPPSQDPPPPDL